MDKKAQCPCCGKWWLFEPTDFIFFAPYPHWECPDCGGWVPAF